MSYRFKKKNVHLIISYPCLLKKKNKIQYIKRQKYLEIFLKYEASYTAIRERRSEYRNSVAVLVESLSCIASVVALEYR